MVLNLKSEDTYVILGSGLYLDPKGKVVDKLPKTNYSLAQLPFQLAIPDDVKSLIKGADLGAIPGALKDAAPLLDKMGISGKAVAIAGACIGLVIGMTSVVGTVGAAISLLNTLFGEDAEGKLLQDINKTVKEILDLNVQQGKQATVDKVIEQWSRIEPARDELHRYLQHQNPGAAERATLERYLERLRSARTSLLDRGFQTDTWRKSDYSPMDWYSKMWWLEPRPGSQPPASANLWNASDSGVRWDYTPYIGPIIELSTVLLAYYKTLDPAFRTTNQFSVEISKLAQGLRSFGEMMTQHIFWTREWNLHDHFYQPMAYGWPVGAADMCSGASAFTIDWKEGVVTSPFPQEGPYPGYHPPKVLNAEETLARAREKRELDWLSVFHSSGAARVLHLAEIASELATPPQTSETVQLTVRRSAQRTYQRSEQRATPWLLGCEVTHFPADVYRVQRTVRVRGTLQAKRYADFYTIPYHFFLESHSTNRALEGDPSARPLSRVELQVGDGTATMNATTFEWEVHRKRSRIAVTEEAKLGLSNLLADARVQVGMRFPNGGATTTMSHRPGGGVLGGLEPSGLDWPWMIEDDEPEGQPLNTKTARVKVDYTFTQRDGGFTFTIRNRPAEEKNFVGVYFVVEEWPRNQDRPLRTVMDVSMIGVELHLPREYFDYIKACEARMRSIVDEMNRKFGARELPVPPWELYDNPGDWVRTVTRMHPGVITGELLSAARTIGRRSVRGGG
jgi:hypothetical protein